MPTTLQSRIAGLKTTAMMEQREKMGPVELVNWWTSFRKNTREMEKFDELDGDVRAQILKWESNPYKDIGA